MNFLFLQNAVQEVSVFNQTDLATLFTFMAIYVSIVFIVSIGVYIYTSMAFVSIAKKAKYKKPNLVWIPFVGKPLVMARISRMNPWPIWLYLTPLVNVLVFFISVPIGIMFFFLSFLAFVAFTVFYFIWNWKTFEEIGRPGWWVLLALIPSVGPIIYFIMLGIAAWSEPEENIVLIKSSKKRK